MVYIDTSKIKDDIDVDKVVNYGAYLEMLLVNIFECDQIKLQLCFQHWYDDQLDKNKK